MDKDGIMVAQYWTTLPPKKEFEAKIHAILEEARERLDRRKALNGGSMKNLASWLVSSSLCLTLL
ncbi:MAG: hypothetical protein LBS84_11250 [Clostridiales bacterium]|jgi:hypothetical protein|nr:hypothetical protein [Clostridiales bacterium]